MDSSIFEAQDSPSLEPEAAGLSTLLASLVIAARFRGVDLSVPALIRTYGLDPGEPSPATVVDIARASGLKAASVRLRFRELAGLGQALPSIVLLRSGKAMVLVQADMRASVPQVGLIDPLDGEAGNILWIDEERFDAAATGEVVLLKRDYREAPEREPFGWPLIVRQLFKDKALTRDIAVSAFFAASLTLAPIMFWRLMIDRVVYYQATNTLIALSAMMVVLIGYEVLFGYLRRYMVVHVSRRIEVALSTLVFSRLLNLPIEFFERTTVGEINRDIGEIWKVRKFLTTDILGVLLDSLVIVLLLPIMFFFSFVLSVIVLSIAGLIVVWLLMLMPTARRKSAAVYRAEGAKGSFLVESIFGIRTVKSLALDSRRRQEWDVHVAHTADLRVEEGRFQNVVQTGILPLERLMTSGVFALAVYLAISTQDPVYVGSLVAFMMMSMRLVQPLSQLALLLPDYDEARIAVQVIGNMVNQPPEDGRLKAGARPPISGGIEFSEVRFRYPGSSSYALDEVSFEVPQGTIFGVVGRSGSGKSTVTRILQMLHSNYDGLVRVDGNDLRSLDIDHLRASIGTVLQDNFLFRGTVRDTIAIGKPDATLDDVIRAARLAGAEEFIDRLPLGYDTWIQEGATNLSGGQRQRLAIARALIIDPRILILDEATSALDADSEAIVNANLQQIARNRTLIIISHRLSSLVSADRIMVMERGRVYATGTHAELLDGCDIYRSLWNQQHRHL